MKSTISRLGCSLGEVLLLSSERALSPGSSSTCSHSPLSLLHHHSPLSIIQSSQSCRPLSSSSSSSSTPHWNRNHSHSHTTHHVNNNHVHNHSPLKRRRSRSIHTKAKNPYMLLPKIMAQPKEENQFTPNRALVVGKFSRYEFEKHRNPDLDEKEFIDCVESRGSDYKSLLFHHNIHLRNRDHIVDCLRRRGIETKIVNRFGYTDELIQWADLIITSGGDGTFLMTASKIKTADKVIIGVNSDPTRSVGHLCLPMKYSDQFEGALDRILSGQFEWQYRQRIRVTIEGQNAFDDPIELHDQQLMHPECRFFELEPFKKSASSKNDGTRMAQMRRTLPFRALNEVFVGESLSSRVSYFELSINDQEQQKIRSSGVTICTGTGSTSWSFNINKLTTQCVSNLFKIINEECFDGKEALSAKDKGLVAKVTDRFNSSLIYDPSKLSMAYTIRDPVVFGRRFMSNPLDFANRLIVKSRMTDAHIVMDGGLSYPFNDGSRAIFEILPEDALKTIKLE